MTQSDRLVAQLTRLQSVFPCLPAVGPTTIRIISDDTTLIIGYTSVFQDSKNVSEFFRFISGQRVHPVRAARQDRRLRAGQPEHQRVQGVHEGPKAGGDSVRRGQHGHLAARRPAGRESTAESAPHDRAALERGQGDPATGPLASVQPNQVRIGIEQPQIPGHSFLNQRRRLSLGICRCYNMRAELADADRVGVRHVDLRAHCCGSVVDHEKDRGDPFSTSL